MKSSTYLLMNLLMIVGLEQLYKFEITERFATTDVMFISAVIFASALFITKSIEDLK